MALTIAGLSKTYPNGVRALDNLSLTIGNNMFGLLGPNGAGKSSLMRTIATLQEPDAGSIDLDGLNVLTEKDAVRRVLGYLPQEFGVYPRMSALDLLNHLAVLKGIARPGERTHIVDDVRELCPRMAIIASGRVLLEGSPLEALQALDGQLWARVVATDGELRALEAELDIVSTHLVAGQHEIRVFAASNPGAGFHAVPSGLEDVYFLQLSRHLKH